MRFIACLAAAAALVVAPTAGADPVRHFDTVIIECGGQPFEIVSKPGSSNFVNTTSVSIPIGVVVVDNATGDVLQEFHKPYTQHHDVTVCIDRTGDGVTAYLEVLNTPPA